MAAGASIWPELPLASVTSIERLAKAEAMREELLRLIRDWLKEQFGPAGGRLVPTVRAVAELRRLRRLAQALMEAESLHDFRALLH
jgi:hypothetical protein